LTAFFVLSAKGVAIPPFSYFSAQNGRKARLPAANGNLYITVNFLSPYRHSPLTVHAHRYKKLIAQTKSLTQIFSSADLMPHGSSLYSKSFRMVVY